MEGCSCSDLSCPSLDLTEYDEVVTVESWVGREMDPTTRPVDVIDDELSVPAKTDDSEPSPCHLSPSSNDENEVSHRADEVAHGCEIAHFSRHDKICCTCSDDDDFVAQPESSKVRIAPPTHLTSMFRVTKSARVAELTPKIPAKDKGKKPASPQRPVYRDPSSDVDESTSPSQAGQLSSDVESGEAHPGTPSASNKRKTTTKRKFIQTSLGSWLTPT